MPQFLPKAANTILYCRHWPETVQFYRDGLGLRINFSSDWFIEFQITSTAYLSLADERRATIKSSAGAGITVTFQVEDADQTWQMLRSAGLAPEPLRDHAWGARVFYLYDPEGHRLEIWSPKAVA